jgi:hypothetical protein
MREQVQKLQKQILKLQNEAYVVRRIVNMTKMYILLNAIRNSTVST